MPRRSRIDAPGALHHIIPTGIERKAIFRDDRDRTDFLERLGSNLKDTQTPYCAFALLPNHFHLLRRTGAIGISGSEIARYLGVNTSSHQPCFNENGSNVDEISYAPKESKGCTLFIGRGRFCFRKDFRGPYDAPKKRRTQARASSHWRARSFHISACCGQSCKVAGSKSAPFGQTSVCTSGSIRT